MKINKYSETLLWRAAVESGADGHWDYYVMGAASCEYIIIYFVIVKCLILKLALKFDELVLDVTCGFLAALIVEYILRSSGYNDWTDEDRRKNTKYK